MPELVPSSAWSHQRWQRTLAKLPPAQRFVLTNSLADLLRTLEKCRDLKLDSELQPWSPERWDVPHVQATQGEWVEYRLGDDDNRGRIVVCYDRKENVIYLVTRTAIHDHQSLREDVANFIRPKS